jgi:nucleotide-binding universal stress UspA family protein
VFATAVEGVAGAEIVNHVHEKGVDLVVMGTAGKTGAERIILGSVAERTVRMANCPVLTVRPVSKRAAIS